jgi:ABC-type sugar transport system substrate-binding protein
MKLRRTRAALAGLAIITLGLAACAGGNGAGTPSASGQATSGQTSTALPLAGKQIGVTPYWLDDANTIYTNAIKDYLSGLGAEVTVLNPEGDAAKQHADVNSFVTNGFDAVVLCPVNTASAVSMLKELQDKGIRTALFWNVPTDEEMQAAGLTAPIFELNDYDMFKEAAAKAVEYVTGTMHQDPKAIIFDDPSNPVLHARAQGFEDGLRAADPNVQVLFRDKVEFDINGARAKLADLLLAYPEANIISPSNGQAALGAYSALQSAGRGKAVDKVADTEYLLLTDATNATMDILLDPSKSGIDLVQGLQRDGGVEVGKAVEKMLLSDDWKSMGGRQAVPSRLMSHSCTDAAEQFASQNSELQDFKAIDCTQYQ